MNKFPKEQLDMLYEQAKKVDDVGLTTHILQELKEYRDMNIVHCKDCKHWGTDIAGETENVKCCEYGKYMVGENGYCVYGEKKECAE